MNKEPKAYLTHEYTFVKTRKRKIKDFFWDLAFVSLMIGCIFKAILCIIEINAE